MYRRWSDAYRGRRSTRRFTELLDRAIRGEVVEVARRGEVVAVIAPPPPAPVTEPITEAVQRWRVDWDVDAWPDEDAFADVRDGSPARPRAVVNGYLLDTNVLSELARPDPHPVVLARLADVESRASVAALTWHELRFGVDRLPAGRRRDALDALVAQLGNRFPVVPYDRVAAQWHAQERARLERVGRPPPFADGQIAAVAVTRELRLVTRYTSDFAGFRGVGVENWWE